MSFKKLGSFEQLEVIDLTRDGEGTETQGILTDHRQFKSQYGDKMAHAYIIECSDNVKRQFYGNTVIDNRLAEAVTGRLIKIIYLGEAPSKVKGQRPYKNFEVFEDDGEEGEDESADVTVKKKSVAQAGSKKSKLPF